MKILYRITLYLIIFLIVLSGLDYFIPDSSLFQDYIRGTFTETLGIIFTIILIEIILANNRKKEIANTAKKGLERASNVIEIYLREYETAAFNLAYKYSDYEKQRPNGMGQSFAFNNLSEFYLDNPSLFDGFGKSKAEAYFERLDSLKEVIRTILFQIDLSNFPEISEALQNYLKYVETYYPKAGILSDMKTMSGQKKTSEFVRDMIANHQGEVKYLHSNMINKYVRLYELMNYHLLFIPEFRNHVKKEINRA